MAQRGLEPHFPDAATNEAEATRPLVFRADAAMRDLRTLPWCSIDNDDSADADQLTVVVEEADGSTRILIAIADVDALVHPGGAVDAHARVNTTSVYTAAGVYPMLPLRLSTDLSSLNEAQDRAALVIEIRVAPGGVSPDTIIYRAWVRNQAQLTYNGVADWLHGKTPPPANVGPAPGLEGQVRLQDRIGGELEEGRAPTARLVLR